MSKSVRFGIGADIDMTPQSPVTGRMTLESREPIAGKASPDKSGLYRVTLSKAQTAEYLEVIASPTAILAAAKAGHVTLSTGQRGKPKATRSSVASIIATAKAEAKAAAKA